MNHSLDRLKKIGLSAQTNRHVDLKHLLSAERAARGSFYATRVGFVAINPKGQRIARAHNGFPQGVRETLERWSRREKDFYHLHAECVGIFNAVKHGYATEDASAYVTHPPCPGCMRALISAGFSEVVFDEQSLLERLDWRDDMERSFELAHDGHIEVMIYRDSEKNQPSADITRNELEIKKVYDTLLPAARGPAERSGISPDTKPESDQWADHPVIQALFACARRGVALDGCGVIVDYRPECRVATALIQSGIRHVIGLNRSGDAEDARWAKEGELEKAEVILTEDAGVALDYAVPSPHGEPNILGLLGKAPRYLDATRQGVTLGGDTLIRL